MVIFDNNSFLNLDINNFWDKTSIKYPILEDFYSDGIHLEFKNNKEASLENLSQKFLEKEYVKLLSSYLKSNEKKYNSAFFLKNNKIIKKYNDIEECFFAIYSIFIDSLYDLSILSNDIAILYNRLVLKKTLDDTGKIFNLTRERVRQIEEKKFKNYSNLIINFLGLNIIKESKIKLIFPTNRFDDKILKNILVFLNIKFNMYDDLCLINDDSKLEKEKKSNIFNSEILSINVFNSLNLNKKLLYYKNIKINIDFKILVIGNISRVKYIHFIHDFIPFLDETNIKDNKTLYKNIFGEKEADNAFKDFKGKPYIYNSLMDKHEIKNINDNSLIPIGKFYFLNTCLIENIEVIKKYINNKITIFLNQNFKFLNRNDLVTIAESCPDIFLKYGAKKYDVDYKFIYFFIIKYFSEILESNKRSGYNLIFKLNYNGEIIKDSISEISYFFENLKNPIIELDIFEENVTVSKNSLLSSKEYYFNTVQIVGKFVIYTKNIFNILELDTDFLNYLNNSIIERIEFSFLNTLSISCLIDEIIDKCENSLDLYLSNYDISFKTAFIKVILRKFLPKNIFVRQSLITKLENINNLDDYLKIFIVKKNIKHIHINNLKTQISNNLIIPETFPGIINGINKLFDSGFIAISQRNNILLINDEVNLIMSKNNFIFEKLLIDNKLPYLLIDKNSNFKFTSDNSLLLSSLVFNKNLLVKFEDNHPLIAEKKYPKAIVIMKENLKEEEIYNIYKKMNFDEVCNFLKNKYKNRI